MCTLVPLTFIHVCCKHQQRPLRQLDNNDNLRTGLQSLNQAHRACTYRLVTASWPWSIGSWIGLCKLRNQAFVCFLSDVDLPEPSFVSPNWKGVAARVGGRQRVYSEGIAGTFKDNDCVRSVKSQRQTTKYDTSGQDRPQCQRHRSQARP